MYYDNHATNYVIKDMLSTPVETATTKCASLDHPSVLSSIISPHFENKIEWARIQRVIFEFVVPPRKSDTCVQSPTNISLMATTFCSYPPLFIVLNMARCMSKSILY